MDFTKADITEIGEGSKRFFVLWEGLQGSGRIIINALSEAEAVKTLGLPEQLRITIFQIPKKLRILEVGKKF